MKKLLEMYNQLTEEQRKAIFTDEQKRCLDGLLFFRKLNTDPAFYKAVESAIGEEVYLALRAQA